MSRFKGYRFVRTLRGEPQLQVVGPRGICFLDMGISGLHYAAEYDGKKWHGPERTEHDNERRDHLRRTEGWVIDVFKDHNIHGRQQDARKLLVDGVRRARLQLGARSWSGQDREQNRRLR